VGGVGPQAGRHPPLSNANPRGWLGVGDGPRVRDSLPPMPDITRDEVAHLAPGIALELTDDELERYAGQLGVIIASVAKVGEVAADDIPPTSHALALTNVTRPDVLRASLDRDEVLAMAPASEDGRFRVPRILDEE